MSLLGNSLRRNLVVIMTVLKMLRTARGLIMVVVEDCGEVLVVLYAYH